jgi:hypothetical protein
MIETSVVDHQTVNKTLQERQIAAFIRGADLEMIEVRGYALTETERAEIEHDANEIYA